MWAARDIGRMEGAEAERARIVAEMLATGITTLEIAAGMLEAGEPLNERMAEL